jgi:ketosteroid isomerase-like protein
MAAHLLAIRASDVREGQVVRRYFDALAAQDFATVGAVLADDVVWHQPGGNRFSGTHRGSGAVNEMIGGMMAVSEGTFELTTTGTPMVNGALVAAPVHFAGKREGVGMAMGGVDLLRIEGDRIAGYGCSPPIRRPRTPSGVRADRSARSPSAAGAGTGRGGRFEPLRACDKVLPVGGAGDGVRRATGT